jgi:non-heme Fe2+,alpha-ketoglutarate-dependent halogenase
MAILSALGDFFRSLVIFSIACVICVLRQLKFLYFLYPSVLKDGLRTWTNDMLWTSIKSLGRRVYVDQPCRYRSPASYQPRCAALPEYQLTEADVRKFYEQGFLGPFRAISEEEMAELKPHFEELISQPSKTYGFKTTRDLHLDSPKVMQLVAHPAVVQRAAQLMGKDLLVWRSNVFEKRASSPEITWHQGTTFLLEQVYKPAFEPRNLDTIFEIGVWMAVDEATLDNGCMQVVPSTHRTIGTIRLTGKKRFLGARFEGDYEIDPKTLVPLPCKPGEFYLFTERLIHGSEPNRSSRPRMSLVFRFVEPDTHIYRGETRHRVNSLRKTFPLDRWAAVLVSGKDTAGINRVVPAEELLPAEEPVEV